MSKSDNVHVTDSESSVKIERIYANDEKLGEGGMGEVHKVFYKPLGELFWAAMKVLDKRRFNSKEDMDLSLCRFRREVKLLRKVRHPNIVGFIDAFEDEKCAYLVMEYVEGVTLDKWVNQFCDEPPVNLLVDILLDVLNALIYMKDIHDMHHRDIKPSNIMVNVLPNGKVHATLIDFGNTKVQEDEDARANGLTMMSGKMAGTVGYLPPGVYQGIYAEEDDVFALAAILLFGFLKYPPFDAEDRDKSNVKIASRDYDLGTWKGTFLGHWIDQNVDFDRHKRMSLKQAQRSLQRFKENPDFFGKCSPEKVKLYSSDTALLSMAEQGRAGYVQFTPTPEPVNVEAFGRGYAGGVVSKSVPISEPEPEPEPEHNSVPEIDPEVKKSLDAVDKSFATSLPSKPKKSKRRLVILLSLLALSVAGAGVAYYLGFIG